MGPCPGASSPGRYGPPQRGRDRQRAVLGLLRRRRDAARRTHAGAPGRSSGAFRCSAASPSSCSPSPRVMGRSGPTKRLERAGLLAALFLPFGLVLVSQAAALAAGFALTAVLFWLLFRGRTCALHGAEHRAIAAVEARSLEETWEGARARPASRSAAERTSPRSPRRSPSRPTRCGRLSVALWTPLAVTMLSLALTMELWQLVQGSSSRLARALLLPGLALQRVTTREPELVETRVALRAVESRSSPLLARLESRHGRVRARCA